MKSIENFGEKQDASDNFLTKREPAIAEYTKTA
jgi:hypothetical protein